MKKALLLFSIFAIAHPAGAQNFWQEVNMTNSTGQAPGYLMTDVRTVSPSAAWVLGIDLASPSTDFVSFVTNNAYGTDGTAFNMETGITTAISPGFSVGNIAPVGASTSVAVVCANSSSGVGGEIIRTNNGGATWNKVTTATQFAASQQGYSNFVHMFDANEGVSFGDPTNGYFEILRTTDGGLTWARIPQGNIPAPLPSEWGAGKSFFALDNTIWTGLGYRAGTGSARVFKSVDRGITWTASAMTPLTGSVDHLAFKDALNGIAFNKKRDAQYTITEVNLMRTSDGGAIWTTIAPVNNYQGEFFNNDIDAANGKYYSVGTRLQSHFPPLASDYGSSQSTDGIIWNTIDHTPGLTSIDVIPTPVQWAIRGYLGGRTNNAGLGGIYRNSSIVVNSSADEMTRKTWQVYPNPSASGIFQLESNAATLASAQLTVTDVLGRKIYSRQLSDAASQQALSLDLSKEKAGVYLLELRSKTGVLQEKLVIQ